MNVGGSIYEHVYIHETFKISPPAYFLKQEIKM
jgi:hypothetical protein